MLPSLKKRNKLFIILIGFLFITVAVFEFSKSFFIENKKNNWEDELKYEIEKITDETRKIFTDKQDTLLSAFESVKKQLESQRSSQSELFKFIKEKFSDKIAIKITSDSDSDFVWSGKYFPEIYQTDTFRINLGETGFVTSDLVILLSVADSVTSAGTKYFVSLFLPIEKEYKLQNRFFENINFTEELRNKFNTDFDIEYSSSASKNKDGRYYSFELLNNSGNKIGIVSFKKPTLDVYLSSVRKEIMLVEYSLLILIYLIIGFVLWLNGFFGKLKFVHIIIFIVYFLGLRILLFISGISEFLFPTDFTNPAYFASRFAFSMVRSPAELFITALFVAFILVRIFNLVFENENKTLERLSESGLPLKLAVVIPSIFIYLLVYRAFGATVKSIMFDSTIIYFKEYVIIPEPVKGFMLANVLIIGFVFVSASVLLLSVSYFAFFNKNKSRISYIVILFFVLQVSGYLFDVFQREPQATDVIRFVFITLTLFLTLVATDLLSKKLLYWMFTLFAGSVLSVILMLHFNEQLEKESIKIYATELIKPNESWLRFLITETLLSDFSREETVRALSTENSNFDASAFKIWTKSPLQREAINSNINILNYKKEILGGFGIVTEEIELNNWEENPEGINDVQILRKELNDNEGLLLKGIFPIKDNYSLLGYLECSILFDITNFTFNTLPKFLAPPPMRQKLIVGLDEIKILEFINGSLKNVIGNIKLSDTEVTAIKSAGLTNQKDKWFELKINDNDYLFYSVSTKQNGQMKYLVFGVEKKNLSRYLFDFFTVIFFHSVLILMLTGLILLFKFLRKEDIKISLRAKLLIAFLVISIIPLILLAVYFRNLTEEKNREAIFYKLGKRAYRIESYVNSRPEEVFPDLFNIFDQAARDLNINYTVFDPKYTAYSTESLFYQIGLIPQIINPEAYLNIMKHGSQDFITKEKIENYGHNAFYYYTELRGKDYIIKVSDAFNKVLLPMSGNEVDAFLIVNYSLAVLLVLILSTILANQISKPIRKLTRATKAVASGDLNIELDENVKGEVKGLVDGFNYMVKELKKNQILLAEVEREAAWKEMAKQVAHEIKNPLTPMKLATQQLIAAYNDKSEKFDEIFKKVTNTIISQIETLGNIASEFSRFARMPAVKVENINPIDIINDAINLFSDENVEIEFVKKTGEVIVLADADQLKRTIINVIRNSIQAEAGKIVISASVSENNFEVRITDNGTGIDDSVIDKIFDMNFTTKEQGTGIGLSMAKKFLESVGGSIEVEKTDSSGTTILIKLKIKR